MFLLKELIIILGIYGIGIFVSDKLSSVVLIPGNILGMLLLFFLLTKGILRTEQIKHTGGFLLKHMGFFFVPLGVALYVLFAIIEPVWIQIVVLLTISSVFVMGVTAKTVEYIIVKNHKKEIGK
jgi:holin-like protein